VLDRDQALLSGWEDASRHGNYQLKDSVGQTRHRHLVALVYTDLIYQLRHDRAQEWAHMRLTTIGEARRQIFRETLDKRSNGWSTERVKG
jgi:hypothetical protein